MYLRKIKFSVRLLGIYFYIFIAFHCNINSNLEYRQKKNIATREIEAQGEAAGKTRHVRFCWLGFRNGPFDHDYKNTSFYIYINYIFIPISISSAAMLSRHLFPSNLPRLGISWNSMKNLDFCVLLRVTQRGLASSF